jgi:methanogenic corrinoid protein MtbC1
MTAYRYVRTGRLAAAKEGSEWQVEEREVARLLHEGSQPAAPTRTRNTRGAEYPRRLVERLITGDEAGSWTVVEHAMAAGMAPEQVYLDLLRPALHTIGERWADGEVSVAQEHQASAIALRLIGRLGPRFVRRGRKRGTILVGTPPEDVHGLPTALMTDLLKGRGFEVFDLGANVPSDSWVSTVVGLPRLSAIGLCATTSENDAAVRETIAALHRVTVVPIVLGGNAIRSAAHASGLGADAYSDSFAEAVHQLDLAATGTPPAAAE